MVNLLHLGIETSDCAQLLERERVEILPFKKIKRSVSVIQNISFKF